MRRFVTVTLGVLLGIGLTIGVQRILNRQRDAGCRTTVTAKLSPNHRMRASLSVKNCAWGFGLAATFASVRIEKLGEDGWIMDEPLSMDQPFSTSVAIRWQDDDRLEATVVSSQFAGSLEHVVGDFRFIQSYVGLAAGSPP